MIDKPIPAVWPDEELEKEMRGTAEFVKMTMPAGEEEYECADHVLALLQRVRELEAERAEAERIIGEALANRPAPGSIAEAAEHARQGLSTGELKEAYDACKEHTE